MAAHGKPKPAGPPPPPPPPPPPAEANKSFMRRMFPFLLAANLFVGAYVLVRAYRKDSGKDPATDPATVSTSSTGKPAEPVNVPRKELPSIPQDEQRQLYKWMLEEKRKIKPLNAAEKKKLDEEKALIGLPAVILDLLYLVPPGMWLGLIGLCTSTVLYHLVS